MLGSGRATSYILQQPTHVPDVSTMGGYNELTMMKVPSEFLLSGHSALADKRSRGWEL